MQLARLLAYGFLTLATFSAPVAAVEPGAPERLISRVDAVGAAMQQQLSAKFRNASKSEKELRGALTEYYSDHGNEPIWIDENGLNSKAIAVIEEFKRAESYGLKSRDYEVPLAEGFKSAEGDKIKRPCITSNLGGGSSILATRSVNSIDSTNTSVHPGHEITNRPLVIRSSKFRSKSTCPQHGVSNC